MNSPSASVPLQGLPHLVYQSSVLDCRVHDDSDQLKDSFLVNHIHQVGLIMTIALRYQSNLPVFVKFLRDYLL